MYSTTAGPGAYAARPSTLTYRGTATRKASSKHGWSITHAIQKRSIVPFLGTPVDGARQRNGARKARGKVLPIFLHVVPFRTGRVSQSTETLLPHHADHQDVPMRIRALHPWEECYQHLQRLRAELIRPLAPNAGKDDCPLREGVAPLKEGVAVANPRKVVEDSGELPRARVQQELVAKNKNRDGITENTEVAIVGCPVYVNHAGALQGPLSYAFRVVQHTGEAPPTVAPYPTKHLRSAAAVYRPQLECRGVTLLPV